MKCNRCDQNAVIRLRQHRLIFCREHYLEWFTSQALHIIEHEKLFSKSSKILVAVSGGKDSLSLWHVLHTLGYNTQAVYINLGIDSGVAYSNRSLQFVKDFSSQYGLNLTIIDLQSSIGYSIPELVVTSKRSLSRTCSVCGLVKRHTLNQAAIDGEFDVQVTGHNLDDEAALLFANVLSWDVELLHRQSPSLQAQPGFVGKAKPFYRFTEREITAYAILNQINYIEDECPFAVNAKQLEYKALLNKLEEEHPGTKLRFYLNFQKEQKLGSLFPDRQLSSIPDQFCPSCHQPTTSDSLCAYCRLFSRAHSIASL